MYEEEKPEEPGAPPPAEGAAVPEYSESTEGMAGGSWWETMSLSVCGKPEISIEEWKRQTRSAALSPHALPAFRNLTPRVNSAQL